LPRDIIGKLSTTYSRESGTSSRWPTKKELGWGRAWVRNPRKRGEADSWEKRSSEGPTWASSYFRLAAAFRPPGGQGGDGKRASEGRSTRERGSLWENRNPRNLTRKGRRKQREFSGKVYTQGYSVSMVGKTEREQNEQSRGGGRTACGTREVQQPTARLLTGNKSPR